MHGKPIANAGTLCPLFRKDVSKVCHKCEWYVGVKGKHPQSEEMIDRFGCAIAWGPALAINTAQEARQTAAAVESFRNETTEQGRTALLLEANRQGLTQKRLA